MNAPMTRFAYVNVRNQSRTCSPEDLTEPEKIVVIDEPSETVNIPPGYRVTFRSPSVSVLDRARRP
jgi:hypothetical protein